MLASIVLASISQASGMESGRHGYNPFVEAMQLMADAMSNAGRSQAPYGSPYSGFSGMPYASPMRGYRQFPEMMQNMMQQMPEASRLYEWGYPGSGALEGTWVGRAGDILEIRGDRFRISDGAGRTSAGTLVLRDNYVGFYDPQTGAARQYEFATQEGRLALRDETGMLLLYMREGMPAQSSIDAPRYPPRSGWR